MWKLSCATLCLMLCTITPTVTAADSILEDTQFSYSNAVKAHVEQNVSMIVVLSSKQCVPCKVYKSEVVARLAERIKHGRQNYVLAVVDVDEQPELAKQLLGTEQISLPYTAIYVHKNNRVFKRSFAGRATLAFVLQRIVNTVKF